MYGQLPEVKVGESTVRGISIRIPNPPKTAVLALPTNDQIIERMDGQKSIRRNLGRRKSTTESMPNTKGDLALFDKIRLDKDGAEFDEHEASVVIGRLTFVDIESSERQGDQYKITLKTPFGDTTHLLNIPIQRDLQRYRRTVVTSVDLPHGVEELKSRTAPACELYDSVASGIEGYSPDIDIKSVPPHHKSAAVIELVQQMEELDPVLDPNSSN